jgi:hypothetical protein
MRPQKLSLSKEFTLQGWGLSPLRRKFFPKSPKADTPWNPLETYFPVSFSASWHWLPAVNTSLNAVSLRKFFNSGSSSNAEYAQ